MGFFKRVRAVNNTAPTVVPPAHPGPTTIHNHSTGWPAIIAVSFACALVLLPVAWWILVFLFDQMGSRNPGREASVLIVSIPLVLAAGWLVKWLILSIMESWLNFRLEIEKEITRREEIKLMAVQTTIEPGRMNEDDYNFARVILAIMMIAYSWQKKNKRTTFPGKWRPWSMRSAIETANGIGVKLSQDRANSVSVWLHQKGVITSPEGGQITKTYPDLSNVRAMLDKEFGKPIRVVAPALRDNRGFEFTD